MADYGQASTALAALQDPTTSASDLLAITTAQPSLWVLVAQHPNAYPDLLQYLTQYGDARVQSAVAARFQPPTASQASQSAVGETTSTARRNRTLIIVASVVVLVCVALVVWFLVIQPRLSGVVSGMSSPTPVPSLSVQSSPTNAESGVTCEYPASGVAAKPVNLPTSDNVENTGTLTVTMHMDAGDVVMDFNRDNAPCAIHSFESLVGQKYFDDTSCHRLVPGFVLQCGDPSGTGRGGPGYTFKDELTGSETYPYGTVAMANSGPDTNGSQFFIVIGENVKLPPDSTVLGSVEPETMATVDYIAAMGVDPDDPKGVKPLEGAHISSVTVS